MSTLLRAYILFGIHRVQAILGVGNNNNNVHLYSAFFNLAWLKALHIKIVVWIKKGPKFELKVRLNDEYNMKWKSRSVSMVRLNEEDNWKKCFYITPRQVTKPLYGQDIPQYDKICVTVLVYLYECLSKKSIISEYRMK